MKTTTELAAEQAAFWNGPGGQGWLAAYQRIEQSIEPFSRVLLDAAAAQAGEQVIDIGCGTGGTTAALARAVGPRGHVLGIDISETLVGAARAQKLDNATFVVTDATRHVFSPASCDLVFSRFGVMFFAEPVKAFDNFRRALKPDGRLVFLCWRTPQENPWGLVPIRAAQPFLPPMPRPGPEEPGQYSFGDRGRVERILKDAGFAEPVIEPVDRPVFLGPTLAEAIAGISSRGLLARVFAEAEPVQAGKAKAAMAEALAPYEKPDGVRLAGACWLVRAGVRS